MVYKPKKMNLSIGGYGGNSYSLELLKGKLKYELFEVGYELSKTEILSVTDDQWLSFREALDLIDVWGWGSRYEGPGICDGTQWGLEIVYEDKMKVSSGSNSYPVRAKKTSCKSEEPFELLMVAVRNLIGGRDFS